MDVFALRNRLVRDYESYVGSFIRITDACIEEQIRQGLEESLSIAEVCEAMRLHGPRATGI